MQTIMASVIVLTYNQQAYIGQALDSILMQKTRFPYEILVGDDASIDKTGSIVRSYAQAYPQIIRPFIRERNLGVTRNLYELLKHTRGKYIASCEGDDFWTDPEKLELQIDFLENHSEYSGCTHNARVIDENGGRSRNGSVRRSVSHGRTLTGSIFPGSRQRWYIGTFF